MNVVDRWKTRVYEEPLYVLTFPIKAMSKERPRAAKGGHFYTPQRTQKFEEAVASWAMGVIDSPVAYHVKLTVEIELQVPKTWSKEKRKLAEAGLILPTKGDLDNKVKAVTDALNGIAYFDDAQISRIDANQSYSNRDHITVTMKQSGLSEQQIEQAIYALKVENGQAKAGRGGT